VKKFRDSDEIRAQERMETVLKIDGIITICGGIFFAVMGILYIFGVIH
jgi:hypothetical protein